MYILQPCSTKSKIETHTLYLNQPQPHQYPFPSLGTFHQIMKMSSKNTGEMIRSNNTRKMILIHGT